MHSYDGSIQSTQLTFHYIDGHTESFDVFTSVEASETQQDIRQELRRLLDKTWWIIHLPEETVLINTANVIKVEMKPAVPQLVGEDVFTEAQRITALTRGAK